MLRFCLIPALLLVAAPAAAEVLAAEHNGFSLRHEVVVDATRAEAWQAALAVGEWWDSDHTVGGDASTMSIDATPLGCFCEKLGDQGGVVHLQVTSVSPQSLLRLTGGLGPLGLMGLNGNMTWEFSAAGPGTRIRFDYAVGGYAPGGLESIAGPVDRVIGEALQRLGRYIESGSPE